MSDVVEHPDFGPGACREEIALAHADLVMAENPGLIGVLSAQWGSPDDKRAES